MSTLHWNGWDSSCSEYTHVILFIMCYVTLRKELNFQQQTKIIYYTILKNYVSGVERNLNENITDKLDSMTNNVHISKQIFKFK